MNKTEFIEWIVLKYMSNVDTPQAKSTKKDFVDTIPDDIDYDFLRVSLLINYDKRIIPDYNYLKQYFKKKTETASGQPKWTKNTWDITARTKDGRIYTFGNYMSVSEYKGIEAFKKGYPELEYISNNRQEVEKYIRESERERKEEAKKHNSESQTTEKEKQ